MGTELNLFNNEEMVDILEFIEDIKKSDKVTIVTHGGIMHADDVMSVALIEAFFIVYGNKEMKFEVIRCERTRKIEDIENKQFVVDVGNCDEFDGKTLYLDHHQTDSGVYPENGIKLAACGKVFDILFNKSAKFNDAVLEYVRTKLLYPIEAADNGQELDVLEHKLAWVKNFNPAFEEENYDSDKMFGICVTITKQILARVFREAVAHGNALKVFTDALYTSRTNPDFRNVLFFEKAIPWQDFYFNNRDLCELIRYIVFEDTLSKEGYVLRTIPKEPNSFEIKFPLPSKWEGLRGEELSKVSGIDGAIFCHKTGFMAKWDTFEHVMQAVNAAIGDLAMMPVE